MAWKANTQILHVHNNSSHFSSLHTGIPLAVSSLHVVGWEDDEDFDEGTERVLE